MATVELTSKNYNEIVGAPGTVFVDFWASWCGPCRTFAPVFEQASEQHPDITFGKVNTEEQLELAQVFGISSIPTLMAVRDGIVLYAEPGGRCPRRFSRNSSTRCARSTWTRCVPRSSVRSARAENSSVARKPAGTHDRALCCDRGCLQ